MIVFLDSGIIGLLSSPNDRELAVNCQSWLYRLLARSVYVVSSDICDYEVRRGLELALHKNPHVSGLSRLDGLAQIVDFLPTERVVLQRAAKIWAQARITGQGTAGDRELDADIIIAAHWLILTEEYPGQEVTIATTNVKHLSRFTIARSWEEIEF
ncbi:type II toxin-antitoxin system VapC family toxin [Chamaesiphon sp.]|uniref:type II toxin-antitoxin system VapC family toxin n=1 Tax=Chamaesiphon sp. TaxID=2814140 RepID=UPI0035933B2E